MTQETLVQQWIDYLEQRRENALNGGVNCIPTPFPNYADYFVGIERSKYYMVTAQTKAGKSQITSYMFLFWPILYSYENPGLINLNIIYFSLEEDKMNILARFASFLLYIKKGIRKSTMDLASTKSNRILEEEVLEIVKADEDIRPILDYFESKIQFIVDKKLHTPEKIREICIDHAKKHGQELFQERTILDDFGEEQKVKEFVGYIPAQKDSYTIVLVDHMGIIPCDSAHPLFNRITDLSNVLMELRKSYFFSPVLIAQQAFDMERDRNGKGTEPTESGIADNKGVSRDVDCLLSLYAPGKIEGIKEYQGYNLSILKDNYRALNVLLNRAGQSHAIYNLYFDGCCCYFEPMPRPDDSAGMEGIYNRIKFIRNGK